MGEWQELAERLVEVDLAIEDLDSWATEPEAIATLGRLEELRDKMLEAIARRWISRGLRERLLEIRGHSVTATPTDPRV